MVSPSVDEMLKDQLFVGRGWRYFTAVLDVDLAPPPASTKPTSRPAGVPTTSAANYFFTTDEGKTTFALEASNRAPFVHEGKVAVRAHVFSCDEGKTSFVGYLSKFSPVSEDPLIKRPGDGPWVPGTSAAATLILNVRCPGDNGKPVEIYPK
jgi:hypothetical protein